MTSFSFREENPKCKGCPALGMALPRHTILDYEYKDAPVDILFVGDSPKMFEGEYEAFRSSEMNVILKNLWAIKGDFKVASTPAVKCPNLTIDTISPQIRKACKVHLHDTIDHYQPKLILACGKVANNVLYGKAKEESKLRGHAVEMETDSGFKFKVVSILHPFQVVAEPKNSFLFSTDLVNAINNELLGKSSDANVQYKFPLSVEELDKVSGEFLETSRDVAVDIETTGLNFLEDTIHTISLTLVDRNTGEIGTTVVVPIDHREASLGYKTKGEFMRFIINVMKNPNNRKVLHHASFDLKFLKRYGVEEVANVYDTRLLQHLHLEDVPKRLKDLVGYYFPEEKF